MISRRIQHTKRIWWALGALIGSCVLADQSHALTDPWRALGHEPSWSLTRNGGDMTLVTDFGATETRFAISPAKAIDAGTVAYSASVEGSALNIVVKDEVCIDSMSGMPRPQQVTITFGARRLDGCGGEPGSLLSGHEWIVTQLADQPLLSEPRITVDFAADGRVSGSASCNRFGAGYQLTGEGLRIEKAMSSMMACEPPVMAQEQLFLDLLQSVSRFSIQANGNLVLHTKDDRSIELMKP
jgi:heat shock protein HslJ